MKRASAFGLLLGMIAVAAVVQTAVSPTRAEEPAPAGQKKPQVPKQHDVAPRYVSKPCDVLIMLSGREQGMMRPCGCSEPQRGGLSRRAALLEDARRSAKASVAISIGDSLVRTSVPQQNDHKAELFRASLQSMEYAGSLLSPGDLSPFWTFLSQSYGTPESTPRPPLNVKIRSPGPLAELARVQRDMAVLRATVGDLNVRAVSLADPTTVDALTDVADAVIPPVSALAALAKEPGLLIVAAHVYREDLAVIARTAAEKADLVIVVDVRGETTRRASESDRAMDKPLFVTFDEHGKEVALVRLVRGAKGWIASWDPVPLDPPYEQGESKARKAVDELFAVYRDNLRKAALLEQFGAAPSSGPTYVGDVACAKCHRAIHEEWQKTKHGRAFDILEQKKADVDPECVGCHVVGWSKDSWGIWSRAESGFATAEKSPERVHVQCESCHGPGSAHAVDGALGTVRKGVTEKACMECHDTDNSVHFDYATYLPKVDHRKVPKAER